nr:unnamed protein product [Callosobruchus chinensis]
MNTFRRLQQLLGKSSDIYSEPGSTFHHPTFSRYTYKAQLRPSLEYCSHIWGATATTTLSILDAVQRMAIGFISDPTLTCHLQPLSRRRAVGDISLFYRYSNGFYSSRSFLIQQEPSGSIAPSLSPGCLGSGMDCLGMYLLSLRVLAYLSPASTNFPYVSIETCRRLKSPKISGFGCQVDFVLKTPTSEDASHSYWQNVKKKLQWTTA